MLFLIEKNSTEWPPHLLSQLKAPHASATAKAFNRESNTSHTTMRIPITARTKLFLPKNTSPRTNSYAQLKLNCFVDTAVVCL